MQYYCMHTAVSEHNLVEIMKIMENITYIKNKDLFSS